MEWLELSVSVPAEQVEEAARLLADIVPGGCSIEDPIVPLGPEEGVRREPWRPSTVRAYLPADTQLAARRTAARAALATLPGAPEVRERPVREEDWAHAWKEFFQVEHIGRRIVIRPTWRAYTSVAGEVVIDLDPGMAFGTGQHETTRLCLAALEERLQPGERVLDLGCGSGILAIAAAKLGAAAVVAVDIEDVAIEATRDNAARNGVEDRIVAARGSLGAEWPLPEPPDRSFDLVLANIHAAAIAGLAPAIASALRRPGATLIGSGIVAERLPLALDALTAAGFGTPDVRAAGDWRAVVARLVPAI
jgi:ribosomal protein L11 methyltransferase